MKRSSTLISTVALVVGCLVLHQHALAATGRVTKSYPLKLDGRLVVENVNGSIKVQAWNGGGVKMEAVKEGRTDEIVAGIKIAVDSTEDRLSIKTELPTVKRGWFWGKSKEGKVNYVLHVPPGAQLESVSSVNGAINVEGIKGGVHVSTVNGSVHCLDLGGDADVSSVNGQIVTWHHELRTGGRLKVKAVNGGIEVTLPATTGMKLIASTVNGSIRSDFEFESGGRVSPRKVRASTGDGGSSVDLSTVNGGIRIHKSAQNSE